MTYNNTKPLDSALTTEKEAANWLAQMDKTYNRQLDETCLDTYAEENPEFSAWLETSVLNRVALLRLLSTWKRADRIVAVNVTTHRKSSIHQLLQKPAVRQIFSVAAVFMIAFFASIQIADAPGFFSNDVKSYETEIGGQEYVPLTDGSTLLLNTDTEVETKIDEAVRRVTLKKGEAFFDISHDESRPFIVDAGDQHITVLGTKFSVKHTSDGIKVTVVEGLVRIDSKDKETVLAPPTLLSRGKIAQTSGTDILVNEPDLTNLERQLSWRSGYIVFDSVPLVEAIEEFNRYNRINMQIVDPTIENIRIGGRFKATNVEAFARLLADGFDLQTTRKGNKIEVYAPETYRKIKTVSSQ